MAKNNAIHGGIKQILSGNNTVCQANHLTIYSSSKADSNKNGKESFFQGNHMHLFFAEFMIYVLKFNNI